MESGGHSAESLQYTKALGIGWHNSSRIPGLNARNHRQFDATLFHKILTNFFLFKIKQNPDFLQGYLFFCILFCSWSIITLSKGSYWFVRDTPIVSLSFLVLFSTDEAIIISKTGKNDDCELFRFEVMLS